MATFKDNAGREWTIAFDGLLLKDLRDSQGINLADLGGADYARIERDASALVTALCCLCGEQARGLGLTTKQLAASITGEALDGGLKAIWGAAELFFPARQLSALKSNCEQQTAMQEGLAMLPPEMRAEAMEALLSGVSQQLAGGKSATGPAVAPSNAA